MFTLCAVLVGSALAAAYLFRQLRVRRLCRKQVVFMNETLARFSSAEAPRFIVSLSTLPDRIGNLRPTLDCLLAQTHLPDEIVLAIPPHSIRQDRPYVVPGWLAAMPKVRVLRCDRDWGPATKFIPAIGEELAAGRSETLIMVVDDDRIYPRDAIASYLHFSAQFPQAALCFRGAAMPKTFDWHHAKMIHGNRLRAAKRVTVITGCGSYLVRPSFFDGGLFDYSAAPSAAFFMDDIWISGSLARRGVERFVVPSSTRLRKVKEQARTMSLHAVPNGRQANNNEVIAWFRDSWDV